eukprot:4177666-Ditylum_brightwellii.AAC.1
MGETYLHFTTKVWYPPAQQHEAAKDGPCANNPNLCWVNMTDGKITTTKKEVFPFLDMVLSCNNENNLQFRFY